MAAEDTKMADEDNEAAGGEVVAKKSGIPIKIVIIGVVGILVVGAVGFGVSMFFMSNSDKHVAKNEEVEVEAAVPEAKEDSEVTNVAAVGSIYTLPTFIVNMSDKKLSKYLKVGINLELTDPKWEKDLTERNSQVRDSLIILLSSKESGEVMTIEGKFKLRDEIISSINKNVGRGKLKNAYFTDFVIQ